jgi:hypothetical protein
MDAHKAQARQYACLRNLFTAISGNFCAVGCAALVLKWGALDEGKIKLLPVAYPDNASSQK